MRTKLDKKIFNIIFCQSFNDVDTLIVKCAINLALAGNVCIVR